MYILKIYSFYNKVPYLYSNEFHYRFDCNLKTNWTIIEIIFYYVLVYSYAFGNFKIILFIRSVYKSYTEEINFYDNIIECIYSSVHTKTENKSYKAV